MGPNGTPLYQNVSGAGRLLVAYDSQGTHYQVTDPLGTRRMQTDAEGVPEMDFEELPYGDGLTAIPDPNDMDESDDATPFHFTGKERDLETGFANGNDYFDARYYASSMGRFLSPDWSAKEDPVPYAKMDDPQSLNLYAYVRNNPISRTDADGHCDLQCSINIALGIAGGIARDGGVGAYSRNVGIGALKGAGQAAYNTYSLAASGGNPGALAASMINQPAALAPSNQTQAQAALVTSTVITVAATLPVAPEVESAEVSAEIPEVMTEGTIFRSGGTNPANLSGGDLSFRDSLSNPIGSGNSPVFSPGDKYLGVDVSKLPPGSAVRDNNPAGHVTVNASAQAIKDATVVKGKIPKVEPQ